MRYLLLVISWTLIQSSFGQEIRYQDGFSSGIYSFSVTLNKRDKKAIRKGAAPEDILKLYKVDDGQLAPVPVSGTSTITGDELTFSPNFPLGLGLDFVALYISGKDTIRKEINVFDPVPLPDIMETQVEQIFPQETHIPSNILFFHVRFTQPMEQDKEAYRFVKVLEENGAERKLPWRHQSYWLDDGHVLVLMVHPGRVKRGIDYVPELGPLFNEGQKYKILIDSGLVDVFGNPVLQREMQEFHIAEADREIPKVLYDEFELPKSGTKDPLVFKFSESMDYASIIDGIKIYVGYETVSGVFKYSTNASRYEFVPDTNWKAESYKVVFTKVVCDFANNRLNRPFEITDIEDIKKDDIPVEWTFSPE